MKVRHIAIAGLTTLAVAAIGCASSDDDGDEASATTTSALQAQSQDGVLEGVVDAEDDAAPEPEVAAQKVVDYPARGLSPEGCAKKVRDGNVVTLTLDDCTGPFGKAIVKGALVATFTKSSSNDLRIDVIASDGTTVNARPLTYAAQADVHFDGSRRLVTYHGASSGTTKRGKEVHRTTDLSIVADVATHCATIDGTSKGSVGRYDVDLKITGFAGCRDACPTAGVARATVNGPLVNASVEVTFDGSEKAHAKISARKTREVDIELDCQANEAADGAS